MSVTVLRVCTSDSSSYTKLSSCTMAECSSVLNGMTSMCLWPHDLHVYRCLSISTLVWSMPSGNWQSAAVTVPCLAIEPLQAEPSDGVVSDVANVVGIVRMMTALGVQQSLCPEAYERLKLDRGAGQHKPLRAGS